MALSTAVGQFVIPNSTGNMSFTGVGFQGKAGIFWGSRQSANNFQTAIQAFYGVAVSSTERFAFSFGADDALGTSDTARTASESQCIRMIGDATAPSIFGSADFVSWDADGFTINVPGGPGLSVRVNYIIFGGTDITSVKAGTFDLATSGASQAFTGPGFQPDFITLMHNGQSAWADAATAKFGIGFASSSSDQAAIVVGARDAQGFSDTHKWQKSGAVFLNSADTTATDAEAALSSFDSSGFTLSVSDLPASAVHVGYLAIKGGAWKVGTETQATSITTKDTALSFTPKSVFFSGVNATNNTSFDNTDCRLSVGGSDGTNNFGTWFQSVDNQNTSNENRYSSLGTGLVHATSDATINAEASTTVAANKFTMNWTTADATAREFIYAAAGDTVVAAASKPKTLMTLGVG